MLDCTGSMEPFITAAEEHIRDFVRSIGNVYPHMKLRLGFVGYRDHCDGTDRLAIMPFTTDVETFECFVALEVAKGGGDGPEDVLGALQAAGPQCAAATMWGEPEASVGVRLGPSAWPAHCQESRWHR